MKEFLRKHAHKYLVFCIGGSAVFFYELGMTIFLTEVLKLWHMYSYSFALLSGVVFLFAYHKNITFHKKKHPYRNFTKFIGIYAIAYVSYWISVYLLTSINVHYVIAITAVTATLSIFTYTTNRFWVFNR